MKKKNEFRPQLDSSLPSGQCLIRSQTFFFGMQIDSESHFIAPSVQPKQINSCLTNNQGDSSIEYFKNN